MPSQKLEMPIIVLSTLERLAVGFQLMVKLFVAVATYFFINIIYICIVFCNIFCISLLNQKSRVTPSIFKKVNLLLNIRHSIYGISKRTCSECSGLWQEDYSGTSGMWGWLGTGSGCPEKLWSLTPWRHARAVLTQSRAIGFRWPCWSRQTTR